MSLSESLNQIVAIVHPSGDRDSGTILEAEHIPINELMFRGLMAFDATNPFFSDEDEIELSVNGEIRTIKEWKESNWESSLKKRESIFNKTCKRVASVPIILWNTSPADVCKKFTSPFKRANEES